MSWIPDTYHTFRRERELAIVDLLGRIPQTTPRTIIDLGCGAGTSTTWIAKRFPGARITGVDSSANLLERAQLRPIKAEWTQANLEDYDPPHGVDLIVSNAALQWVPDHPALIPRLMRALPPSGVLAIQVPANHDEPSHNALLSVTRNGPWAGALAHINVSETPVLSLEQYYAAVSPLSDRTWIWQSLYLHPLTGPAPVLEWMRGSTLATPLAHLDGPTASAFVEALAKELDQAYPRRADGITLFPFRRTFLVAERG